MPLGTFRDQFVHRRRTSLLLFCKSAFLSAISLSLVGKAQSYRVPLLSLGGLRRNSQKALRQAAVDKAIRATWKAELAASVD